MKHAELSAGELTEGENRYLHSLHDALQSTLEGRLPFQELLREMDADLRRLLKEFRLDVDEAYAAKFVSGLDRRLQRDHSDDVPPLSEPEADFVKDMKGLIEFATRNRTDPHSVFSMLFHDVSAIVHQFEGNVERSRENFFLPMSYGWWKRNVEPVGEPEEQG